MSPDFAAAVCEGIYGTLEELLSQELPDEARRVLLDLQERAGIAVDALTHSCEQRHIGSVPDCDADYFDRGVPMRLISLIRRTPAARRMFFHKTDDVAE
jgi:hypothetical protein